MENKFYQEEDFAQFLKDSTEDFKMYPNRRVWHSLYKDMHPSQKWPSVAVCLLLIGSIMFLGVANNNQINKNITATITERKVPANTPLLVADAIIPKKIAAFPTQQKAQHSFLVNEPDNTPVVAVTDQEQEERNDDAIVLQQTLNTTSALPSIALSKGQVESKTDNYRKDIRNVDAIISTSDEIKLGIDDEKVADVKKSPSIWEAINAERSFMDNDIFYNLKRNNKLINRTSLFYYFTPSVGFRTLKQKALPPGSSLSNTIPLSTASISPFNINDKVSQSYSVNIEAGTGVKYNLTKRLAVTTGVQFNYTNYVSYANTLQHLETAGLFLTGDNGSYEVSRASAYANTVNGNYTVLNNTTIQFSIPLGVEYSIVNGKRIKWNVGGSIQPGIIASGKAYALSSDNTHYIEDQSLFKNTVLNSSLQTTISYRTKNGVTIFAGPQMRYQLTDTHKSKYNYSERLYNYGLKIGLSRNL